MKKLIHFVLCVLPLIFNLFYIAPACSADPSADNDYPSLKSEKNFLTGYPALNEDGTMNAVIEIPAGNNAKYEVTKSGEAMEINIKDGKPRLINYLAYQLNYGMVPQTVLSKKKGGDGDPLDVLVLGPSLPRGSIHKVKVIGAINHRNFIE